MMDRLTVVWRCGVDDILPSLPPFLLPPLSHQHTASASTVRAHWTRTAALLHFHTLNAGAVGTPYQWRVVVFAEFHINQVRFPASYAVISDVLSAH